MIKNSVIKLCAIGLIISLFLPITTVYADEIQPGADMQMTSNGVAVDDEDNVIVTGQVYEDGKWVIQTEKYAASDGHMLWSKRFDYYNYNIGKDVAVDGNGNIIVAGSVNTSVLEGFDYCLIKYDEDGSLMWHKTYHRKFYDTPWRLVIDNNTNNIYVAGMSLKIDLTSGLEGEFWTLKCDSTGTLLKDITFNGNGHADFGFGIAIDNQGDIIVTGASDNNQETLSYCTLKYDSNLDIIWGPKYYSNSGEDNSVSGVAIDSNDNIYITGGSEKQDGTGSKDFLTVNYDKNGNYQEAVYRGFSNECNDDATGIDVDSNDNIVITGTSCENSTTIKYSSTLQEVNGWPIRGNFQGGTKDVVVDSNNNVIITGFNSAEPNNYYTVKYSSAGTIVWDGGGGKEPPQPPTVDFTFAPTNPTSSDYVRFYDKSSGNITTWDWSFGDGSSSSNINPLHQYSNPGNFEVTLTVIGPAGEDTVTKTITVDNTKPTAVFEYAPNNPKVDNQIEFDGSGAYDEDGSIVTWQWSFGDGGSDTGKKVYHAYSAIGTYTVTLTITDDYSETASATKFITVNEVTDVPPIADFTWSPTNPAPGEPVIFDASSSSDEDGNIKLYQWDWESDGTYSNEDEYVVVTATHTWSKQGTYNVTVKVTDNNDTSNTKTLAVHVGGGSCELIISSIQSINISNGEEKSFTVTVFCSNASAGLVILDVVDSAGTTIDIFPASTSISIGESKDFRVDIKTPDNELSDGTIQLLATGDEGVQSDIFEIQLIVDDSGGNDGSNGIPGFAALAAIGAIFITLLILRRMR